MFLDTTDVFLLAARRRKKSKVGDTDCAKVSMNAFQCVALGVEREIPDLIRHVTTNAKKLTH